MENVRNLKKHMRLKWVHFEAADRNQYLTDQESVLSLLQATDADASQVDVRRTRKLRKNIVQRTAACGQARKR